MGEIEVKLDVLKTCAGSLAQSASSLEGKRSEIESIASNLSLSEVSKAQVKKKLQNLTRYPGTEEDTDKRFEECIGFHWKPVQNRRK